MVISSKCPNSAAWSWLTIFKDIPRLVPERTHPVLFLTLITASLLVGTVGVALSGDPSEDDMAIEDDGGLGSGDDDFRGTFGGDETSGEEGDDLLSSLYSADDLDGGPGDDTIAGGAQDDLINGGDGDDVLSGGTGDDEVFGEAGDDTVMGGIGNDQVWGGEGDDFVVGGDGSDLVVGGQGEDILRGGTGDDFLIGANIFREDIKTDDLSDTTLENVIIYSDDIDDQDFINADEGNDTILVGKNDVVFGGEGADQVITGTWVNGEVPTFTDYVQGTDKIVVSVDAATSGLDVTVTTDELDAIINVDGEPVLRVSGGAGVVTSDDVELTLELMTDRPA